MDNRDTLLEQLVVQPFVRFDEDKGDFQAIELIDDGSAHLTVSANDEMIPDLFQVCVVYHLFPRLPSLLSENGDEHPFRDPDLKGENPKVDHQGEEFRGIPDLVVMDRMGMEDPEQGVLPLDPFQVRVGQHAEEDEDGKQQNGQPQLPEEDDQDAGRCRSNRRILPGRIAGSRRIFRRPAIRVRMVQQIIEDGYVASRITHDFR
jgi:hypothetical protein